MNSALRKFGVGAAGDFFRCSYIREGGMNCWLEPDYEINNT